MRTRAGAIRIATGFFAVFFVLGIHVPYWPVWLQSRDLSPQQIGLILALGPWMRLVANPLAGQWADATGATRRIAVVLAMGVTLTYLAFSQASSFVTYVALAVVLGLCANPLIPLTDAVAVRVVAQGRGDYGSLRRWGSLAFATFGALHLGAMEFVRRRVGAAATTRATTTYSAVAGVAMGLGLPLSGWLYDDLGGTTYWAMAGCSVAGLLAAGWLHAAIRRTDDAALIAARNNDAQVDNLRAGTGPGRDR